MRNELKLGLIFFVCSSFAAAETAMAAPEIIKTQLSMIDVLLHGLRDTIETGKQYVEDTERFQDKLQAYSCAEQFLDRLTFIKNRTLEAMKEYHTCLKLVNEGEYSEKNIQFSGFEPFAIQFDDEEDWNARYTSFFSKNKITLPHPMALLSKAADDIGKFAFQDRADDKAGSPRARFVIFVKEALRLILNRNNDGDLAFEGKLHKKLDALAALCKNDAVYEVKEPTQSPGEQINSELSDELLLDLGQKFTAILASAGGKLVLPFNEKVKMGAATAKVLYPTYTGMLKEREEKTGNWVLTKNDLVKLGDEVIKEIAKFKKPGQLEDDYDAKSAAVEEMLLSIRKIQESKSIKTVKKAEFKEAKPLENSFRF